MSDRFCFACRTSVTPGPGDDEPCPTCAAPTRLRERWRVLGPLARGGSARVFRGFDTEAAREVALKVLELGEVEDWKQVELFERQLPLLRRLRHRGIPEVHDAFEHQAGGRTLLVLVQSLHRGQNLRDALADGLRFDERSARAFLDRMLDILGYLHGFSPPILHRDIKPANILLELPADGDLARAQPVLIDFDTARGVAIDTAAADGTMVGSAGFVPLEQLAGRPVPASDLYGLGVTVIAALSQRDVLELPVERSRLRFQAFVNVSRELVTVLERMVEPIVEDRLPDVAAVRRALAASAERPDRAAVRRRVTMAGVAFVGLAALGLGAGAGSVRIPDRSASSPCPLAEALALCRDSLDPACDVVMPCLGRFAGMSVAVDGDTLALGFGTDRGGAQLYTRADAGWTADATLEAPRVSHAGQFGRSIALDGDTLAVGARLGNDRKGAIHVYARQGGRWTEQATLLSTQPESRFGEELVVSGDTLAAVRKPALNDSTVVVYARRDGTWEPQAELPDFRGTASLALSGDTLAIGVPMGTRSEPGPGVHVYVREGTEWREQARLHYPPDPALSRGPRPFVRDVALSGDTLVVTMPRAPVGGQAHVYTRTGAAWTEKAVLHDPSPRPPPVEPDTGPTRTFGVAAAVSGDTIAVTAYDSRRDAEGIYREHTEIHLFARDGGTWRPTRVLDAALFDEARVALDGGGDGDGVTVVIGAPYLNHARRQYWPGAALVVELGRGRAR
ncbi:MAG: protein kinase [Deltaproteobacteria bacterium]|nr:protein kinase [Kofleriaceae bacterium]